MPEKVKMLRTDWDAITNKAQSLQMSNDALAKQITGLQGDNRELHEKLQGVNGELERYKGEILQLKEGLEQQLRLSQNSSDEYDIAVKDKSKLETDNERLSSENEYLQRQMDNLTSRNSNILEESEDFAKENTQLQERLDNLQEHNEELKEFNEELESEAKEHIEEIANLNAEVEELKDQVASWQEANEILEEEKEALSTKVLSLEKNLKSLENDNKNVYPEQIKKIQRAYNNLYNKYLDSVKYGHEFDHVKSSLAYSALTQNVTDPGKLSKIVAMFANSNKPKFFKNALDMMVVTGDEEHTANLEKMLRDDFVEPRYYSSDSVIENINIASDTLDSGVYASSAEYIKADETTASKHGATDDYLVLDDSFIQGEEDS